MAKSLFEAYKISANLTVKNRLVLAPLYYDWEFASRAFMKFYEMRAKGGVALAIVPVPTHGGLLDLTTAEFEEKSIRFLERMRSLGCAVVPQVFSGVGEEVNAFSRTQLMSIPREFAVVAEHLERIGYAGMEIHGAHHSLYMSLLSSGINQRLDEYGGSFSNRSRLQIETVKAIKSRTPGFPLFYRFSANEFSEGGISLDTACEFAERLEAAGADCIDVSAGGTLISPQYSDAPDESYGEGCFAVFSREIKQRTRLPVIVAGRISSFEVANGIVSRGDADLLALGRVLVKEADWPKKIQAEMVPAL